MKPIRTVGLLPVLQRAGLDDGAFHIVHHFGERESIASHLNYCLPRGSFQPGSNNEIIQKRLEYVLNRFLDLGESAASRSVFAALAHESAAAFTK